MTHHGIYDPRIQNTQRSALESVHCARSSGRVHTPAGPPVILRVDRLHFPPAGPPRQGGKGRVSRLEGASGLVDCLANARCASKCGGSTRVRLGPMGGDLRTRVRTRVHLGPEGVSALRLELHGGSIGAGGSLGARLLKGQPIRHFAPGGARPPLLLPRVLKTTNQQLRS